MQLFVRGDMPTCHHGKHLRLGNAELLLEGLDRHTRFPLPDVLRDCLDQRRGKVMHRILAHQRCSLRSALTFDLPLMDYKEPKTGFIAKPRDFSKAFFLLFDPHRPLDLEYQPFPVGKGQ